MGDRTGVSRVAIAKAVRTAALSVPGVVSLQGGTVGEYATRGPDERVFGVRIQRRPDRVGVRVVAQYGVPLPDMADGVTRAVTDVLGEIGLPDDTPVDVRIVDITTQGPEADEPRDIAQKADPG